MPPFAANSLHGRDIAAVLHPQTHAGRHLQVGPTVITGSDGIYVADDEGRHYLDAGAGLWCASLGYRNDRLAATAAAAMSRLGYYQIFRHASNGPAVELSERLLAMAPVPMSKVLLQCSGSEANDAAVKLVWYHWHAQGQPAKRKIISRAGSYHGSTIVATSLTARPDYHAGFGLPLGGFLHTGPLNFYRDGRPGETEQAFARRLADELEAMILVEGPETIGAFFCDPVQGSAGAVPPPAGYFDLVQPILRRHDILLVVDEVICGFGCTGSMWGSQTYDLRPDILTCGKALSAAMQPISALLLNERLFESVVRQSDTLAPSCTAPPTPAIQWPRRSRWERCASTTRSTCSAMSARCRPPSCRQCAACATIRWWAISAAWGLLVAWNWCRTRKAGRAFPPRRALRRGWTPMPGVMG